MAKRNAANPPKTRKKAFLIDALIDDDDSPIGKKRPLRRRNAVDYTVLEAELAAAPAKAVFESKRRVKGSKPANGRKPTKQGPADPRRRKEKTGKENSKEKKKKPAVLSPSGRSIKPVRGRRHRAPPRVR